MFHLTRQPSKEKRPHLKVVCLPVVHMGASQNIRSGTRSGTTPVPYPRSIPPFHTCLKDPFHTSVPYLWSIHYDLYIYIYTYIYICIYFNMCSLILHLYAHTWAHTYMSMYMQKYVYYAQALWLWWMCLGAASWQSKNGLLVTLPPSQPVAGLRLHHLQLLPAVAQLWCLMVEMRLAVASWQSKNCSLRYSRSKLPILINMCCCAGVGRFVLDPVPYRSIPVPDPDHPCTTPDPLPGEQMAGSHRNCS